MIPGEEIERLKAGSVATEIRILHGQWIVTIRI